MVALGLFASGIRRPAGRNEALMITYDPNFPSTSFPTSRRILALFSFPTGLLEPSVSIGYWDGIWDPQSR